MGRAARDRGEDFLEAVPLYAHATGFDQAQARTDMLFVQDRLVMCTSEADQGDTGLVHQVARRLVHWLAEGRPADPRVALTEVDYAKLTEFNEGGPQAWKAPHSQVLQAAYRQAWREAIESEAPD